MGVVVVLTITVVTPRLGAAATIGLLIAGQLAMGVAIDRYGWFGVEQVPLTWPRVARRRSCSRSAPRWRSTSARDRRCRRAGPARASSSRPVASRSAETTAAVETTVGGSPTPLTP